MASLPWEYTTGSTHSSTLAHGGQGWGPLCAFLGVAELEAPFPLTNTRKKVRPRSTARNAARQGAEHYKSLTEGGAPSEIRLADDGALQRTSGTSEHLETRQRRSTRRATGGVGPSACLSAPRRQSRCAMTPGAAVRAGEAAAPVVSVSMLQKPVQAADPL